MLRTEQFKAQMQGLKALHDSADLPTAMGIADQMDQLALRQAGIHAWVAPTAEELFAERQAARRAHEQAVHAANIAADAPAQERLARQRGKRAASKQAPEVRQ
jgi:hypothetical protein